MPDQPPPLLSAAELAACVERVLGERPGTFVGLSDDRAVGGVDAYGRADQGGTIVGLFTAASREASCSPHDACLARAGKGLDGDRYAEGLGTFSHPQRRGQDLTLIEAESLDELAAQGVELSTADARRNVVTRGIRLNELVGHRFAAGDVVCYGARLAEPCAHLQRLTTPGVLRGLVHRGGIRADVLDGGELHLGDVIRLLPEPEDRT